MRGTTPYPIQITSGAFIANKPPHLAPSNSIVAGANVFLDIDGLVRPRSGYTPFIPGNATVPGGPRLHGGIQYEDSTGNFQYVVASNQRWFADVNGAWTDISDPANLNNGASTDPERFHEYAQGGQNWVIGVDNFSTPKWWNSSLSEYQILGSNVYSVVTIVGNGTTATVTIGTAVTNIIVGDSITITGNTQSPFNGTFIVTGVTSGTVFTFASTNNATGSGGTATDITLVPAPPARDIEVLANRVVLINTTEGGQRFPRRVRWSAEGDATRWPQLAFIDTLDANDQLVGIASWGANQAVMYGQVSYFWLIAQAGADASAFGDERLQATEGFTGPASSAAIVRAEGQHWYAGIDGRAYAFNGMSMQPVSTTADPFFIAQLDTSNASRAHGAYLPSKRQVWLWLPTLTATSVAGDPSMALVIDLGNQWILPPQFFSEGITMSFTGTDSTGLTWETIPDTWTTNPYTWDDIPTGLEVDIFTGTASGEVDLFFHGYLDGQNLFPIAWNFTITYMFVPDYLSGLLLNRAEFFFKPSSTPELASAQFIALQYPYDPGNAYVAILVSPGWTNEPLEPGPLMPSNTLANYILLNISSAQSFGTMAFAGGTIWTYTDPRRDYANG